MSANDTQVAGTHYSDQVIQVWDYVTINNIPYLEGNVIRYISRWRAKGGLQDLLKAKHYVEKLIENEQQRLESESPKIKNSIIVQSTLGVKLPCGCLDECVGHVRGETCKGEKS